MAEGRDAGNVCVSGGGGGGGGGRACVCFLAIKGHLF